ncbi:uncharacterized protein LOC122260899 [Penaeus japonicus]|uniref:uncharacterized protein LOC122260899 n=1 Tax=Penaeus japonicus TaxID=27405 RepID=UPI001C71620F|nr:uncharacterized protein LOC122260899 [Penaeus japonicus]
MANNSLWKDYGDRKDARRVESILIPIFKNKGDIQNYGSYRGIKLRLHKLKIWERVIEKRLRKRVQGIPRQKVWNCLRLKEVEEKHIRLIKDMYERSKRRVRCAAGKIEDFEVTVGLHQGSTLSPIIFAIIMDCMTRETQREAQWDMLAGDVAVNAEAREEAEERVPKMVKGKMYKTMVRPALMYGDGSSGGYYDKGEDTSSRDKDGLLD